MSEFTKLGGYLIQGQPEVVHDSALSGNGLEGSPLGLSEDFITGTMRPATQSALNLNIGHPENNSVAEAGATIGSNNAAASTGLAVGFGASAFGMSIAVGENTHASNRGIAVGNGLDANGIAAFGTYNSEINTGHDCIFVVGNGTDSANRSDAFKIYKDGRVEAPNFVTTNNVHLSALTGVSEANDLVHSNSGTWDGVSAKLDTSAFSDVSGTFLTAHQDLSDYQTTAGMTAYQSAGDYYSASNPSGFITGVPAGTMNESAFGYDASNNITAYNGSAFKAGDEFPQSATEAIETVTANSADWNGTTETVSSNSGAWGGSALPISAGPGIKLEMVNDTLVASTDETLLYSYTGTAKVSTGILSEPATNFDLLRVTFREIYGASNLVCGNLVGLIDMSMISGNSKSGCSVHSFQDGNATGNVGMRYGTFELTSPNTFSSMQGIKILNSTAAPGTIANLWPVKVVGINRIAGV